MAATSGRSIQRPLPQRPMNRARALSARAVPLRIDAPQIVATTERLTCHSGPFRGRVHSASWTEVCDVSTVRTPIDIVFRTNTCRIHFCTGQTVGLRMKNADELKEGLTTAHHILSSRVDNVAPDPLTLLIELDDLRKAGLVVETDFDQAKHRLLKLA